MLDDLVLLTSAEDHRGIEPAALATRTLIVGYGNIDRQDDGVAWYVLSRLSGLFGGLPIFTSAEEMDSIDHDRHALLFQLQLTPELAETFLKFDRIIFIDAQTGESAKGVEAVEVNPVYQPSPLTHHLTPEACMALLKTVYQHSASAILVTIQGHQFGFGANLSASTALSVDYAAQVIENIMQN